MSSTIESLTATAASTFAAVVSPTTTADVAPSLLADPNLCTLATCPISMGSIEYVPDMAANVVMAAIFGLVLITQIGFGIRYKTWGFMAGMIGGNTLEVIGYIGRIQLSSNIFNNNAFLMYLVCLTIAPAFLSASIYLCLSRIVVAYGEGLSRFKPGTYTIMFICFDFIALLLQAAGGAIASIADSGSSMQDAGINLMIAGVSWQVASLAGFIAMCLEFFLRVRKATPEQLNPLFSNTRRSVHFRAFLWSLGIATLFIFIRSVYRTAELSQGFGGHLANDQVTFMILEATMIALAVIALTVVHPGIAFRGQFADAGWTIKRKSTGMKLEKMDDVNTDHGVPLLDVQRPADAQYRDHSPRGGRYAEGEI